ncbi:hypothetical protein ABZ078_22565 [Streptomyces sp. NPDC006385]|uniref:hypothetical protein n=1 Tax=Streptomyces sp. NPDC006385 TaxID=3156761 RepID=UPI0033A1BBBE
MIATSATPSLLDVRNALRNAGLRQAEDHPGLPVVPEVETWASNGEIIIKIGVAPHERLGADAIPARVHDALLACGFGLSMTTRCDDTSDSRSPAAVLASGDDVAIICTR